MIQSLENRRLLAASLRSGQPPVSPVGPCTGDAIHQHLRTGKTTTVIARPVSTVTQTPLSAAEAADLKAIARDEKLARDVYTAMYTRWGNTVFKNIAASEQQHFSTVSSMLTKYKIANPVAALPAGKFDDPAIQDLYNKLVTQGNQSVAAAMRVGIQIEELDISDLKTASNRTTHADIKTVYSNLLRGSQNHLAAFKLQLDRIEALRNYLKTPFPADSHP